MISIKKIASAQVSPIFLNKQKTVQKACNIIREAGEKNAELIVFPEAYISGYPDWIWLIQNSKVSELNELYVDLINNSLSIPDDSTDRLCEAAKDAGIHVIMGLNERNSETSNTSLFNTLLFIDNKGIIFGKHRKLMPTGGEKLIWAQGDGSTLKAFDTSIGKIGGLICWENYMPLARYAMYSWGTQILAAPTWDKSINWLSSLQYIAREGGLFIVNCCMALKKEDIPDQFTFTKLYPEEREWINIGNSCVINPKGEIIAGPIEAKEEIIYAEIDFQQITASKRMFDAVGHYSRPDVFKLSVNQKPNLNIETAE